MELKDNEKVMLADDLTAYIKDKHTKEECIGFIDGYKSALTKLKLLNVPPVVKYYRLKDGDEIKEGDECYTEKDEWEVTDCVGDEFCQEDYHVHRRELRN